MGSNRGSLAHAQSGVSVSFSFRGTASSAYTNTSVQGFLRPLSIPSFPHVQFTNFITSVRLSTLDNFMSIALYPILVVQLLALSFPPQADDDTTAFLRLFLIWPLLNVFKVSTVAQVAVVACACVSALALLWTLIEVLVVSEGKRRARLQPLYIFTMLIGRGPLLIPFAQMLSIAFVAPSKAPDAFAGVYADISTGSLSHVAMIAISTMGLGCVVAVSAVATCVSFSHPVSPSSSRLLSFPSRVILLEHPILMVVAMLATTDTFGFGHGRPTVTAGALVAVETVAAAVQFFIPHFLHPVMWTTHLAWYGAVLAATIATQVTPLLVWSAPFIAAPIVVALVLAKFAYLHLLLHSVLDMRLTEDDMTVGSMSRGILKQPSSLLPSLRSPTGPYTRYSFTQYIFALAWAKQLYMAEEQHDRERFELLGMPYTNGARVEAKQTLAHHLQRHLEMLCASRFTGAMSRLALIQYTLTVSANVENAIFEACRIPSFAAMDLIPPIDIVSLSFLTALHASADGYRRKHDCGTAQETHGVLMRKQRAARDETEAARKAIHYFWQCLSQPDPNITLLLEVSESIHRHSAAANSIYVELIKTFPDRDAIIRSYAEFVRDIRQDPEKSALLYQCADDISVRRRNEDIRNDGSSDNGSSQSASSMGGGYNELNVLDILKQDSDKKSSAVRRLNGMVNIVLLTLTAICALFLLQAQVRITLIETLVDIAYNVAGTAGSAAESTLLAEVLQVESISPGAVSGYMLSDDPVDVRLKATTAKLREHTTAVVDGVTSTTIGLVFPGLNDLLQDRRLFAASFVPLAPVSLQETTTGLLDYISSIVVSLDRVQAHVATARDQQFLRANGSGAFLDAARLALTTVSDALTRLRAVGAVADGLILVVVLAIIAVLQLFVLRRAFNDVGDYQTESINLFLHLDASVVEQMVRNSETKKKPRKKPIMRSKLATRAMISFKDSGPDLTKQLSRRSVTIAQTVTERTELSDTDLTDDSALDDGFGFESHSQLAHDEVTTQMISTTEQETESALDSDDSPPLMSHALIQQSTASITNLANGISTNSLVNNEGLVQILESEILQCEQRFEECTTRLHKFWVVGTMIATVVAGALITLGVMAVARVVLTLEILDTVDTSIEILGLVDEFSECIDSMTWTAFSFVENGQLTTLQEYWAYGAAREREAILGTLIAIDMDADVRAGIAAAQTGSTLLEYLELIAVRLVLPDDFPPEASCPLYDFTYNYTAETTYHSDLETYQRTDAVFALGYYTDAANDTALDPDLRQLLARTVLSDDRYWTQRDNVAAYVSEARASLQSSSDTGVTDITDYRGWARTVSTVLMGVCVLTGIILGICICCSLSIRAGASRVDSKRVAAREIIFETSAEEKAELNYSTVAETDETTRSNVASRTSGTSFTSFFTNRTDSAIDIGGETKKPFIDLPRVLMWVGQAIDVALMALFLLGVLAIYNVDARMKDVESELSGLGDLRLDIAESLSALMAVHRDLLADARLFAQFQDHGLALAFEEGLQQSHVPYLTTVMEDEGLDLAVLEEMTVPLDEMRRIERISIALELWGSGVGDTVLAELSAFEYDIADEDTASDTVLFSRPPRLYTNSTYDRSLDPDTQCAIGRAILFDEKFASLLEAFSKGYVGVVDTLENHLQGQISDTTTTLELWTGLLVVLLAAEGVLTVAGLRSIWHIASPRQPTQLDVIKQRPGRTRITKFFYLSSLNLYAVAAIFVAIVGLSLASYFLISLSDSIDISARRILDFFVSVNSLVPIATQPSESAEFYELLLSANEAFQDDHGQLVGSHSVPLIFANSLRSNGGLLDAIHSFDCDNCSSIDGLTLSDMIAVFEQTSAFVSPSTATCICDGGVDNEVWAEALRLETTMATGLWAELEDYRSLLTTVLLVYRIINIPVSLAGLLAIGLSYRLVFRPMFRSLQHSETMIQGLLKMIPSGVIGETTLLAAYLKDRGLLGQDENDQ
ncbi:hypothetical protein J8273_7950 [Carpediemonas membranifera]|uniref:TmcB/TmcC TPR repeats domain-containing protein n=1 Tax=Carpediemonas membranifera TaxID=201153 RepID=A0A8J6B0Y5_9EUKA|nr:hypothetical protein J8273_7950 [Carpediemonas membranifera]|eukprot:KAG9390599.1 hypothetical protein J8273_7950 [Carpediemonas membranifera]